MREEKQHDKPEKELICLVCHLQIKTINIVRKQTGQRGSHYAFCPYIYLQTGLINVNISLSILQKAEETNKQKQIK